MATNTGYALNTNKWFLGQVPPNQNQFIKNSIWEDVHGDRVKVRIPGMHPVSGDDGNEVIDDDLPWAIVAKPTTHGSRNYQSTGIFGGEWVIGFFLDEDCQIPVITQVLGNNLSEYDLTESENGTTRGKRVSRFNSGLLSGPHATLGATSVNQVFEQPTQEVKEQAKQPLESENVTPEEDTSADSVVAEQEDAFANPSTQTAAEAAAQAERIRQKQTVDRALGKIGTGDIAGQPGGVIVNRTPTPDELQTFESAGYTYVPGPNGDGGRIVKDVGQNNG